MMLTSVFAGLLLAAGPVQGIDQVNVAFDELNTGQNRAAIVEITQNDKLELDDPARLLNLGVAYAREGETELARELFRAAIFSDQRLMLETANGEWIDSRSLARQALARLDQGEFTDASRMASR